MLCVRSTVAQLLLLLVIRCVCASSGQEKQTKSGDDGGVYLLSAGENNVMRISTLKITPEGTLADTPIVAQFELPVTKVPGAKLSHDYIKKGKLLSKTSKTNSNSSALEQDPELYELTRRIQMEIDDYVKDSNTPIQEQVDCQGLPPPSSAQHIIEILVVVDYGLFIRFSSRNFGNMQTSVEDIRAYYSNIFRATNERFGSTSSGSFSIRLVISGIIILMTPNQAPWTLSPVFGNQINVIQANPLFAAFTQSINSDIPHDLAVLFTTYRLQDSPNPFDAPSEGYTPAPGLLCNPSLNTVWITEELDEKTSLYLARYVAQSIGIRRDGSMNTCSPLQLFIMTNVTGNFFFTLLDDRTASNPWSFSACSVAELRSRLANPAYICTLARNNFSPFNPDPYLAIPFGQRYNADAQCGTLSPNAIGLSTFCRDNYRFPFGLTYDDMCHQLRCGIPLGPCQSTLAHDGTICGDRQTCFRGQCVRDRRAPPRPDQCPQLDNPASSCTFASCLDTRLATTDCCGTCTQNFGISTIPPSLPAPPLVDSEPYLFRLLFDEDKYNHA